MRLKNEGKKKRQENTNGELSCKKPASPMVTIKTVAICELSWIMNDTRTNLAETQDEDVNLFYHAGKQREGAQS
jgi:hypothetical protein